MLLPFQIGDAEIEEDVRVRRWLIALLVVGVFARVIRFILRFPLWEDECFVSYNLIDRDFSALAGPLDYRQVAPILFLWAQKTVVLVLGYSELPLRLVPFLCSLVSLAMFVRLAKMLLRGTALLFAVGFFAVAYPAIRYGAEAKQYGVDLAVSVALITLAVQWLRDGRGRWLWLLAALMPVAVLASHPSVFIAGTVSVALLPALRRSDDRRNWLAWVAMNVAMVGTFAISLWHASTAHQGVAPFMNRYWQSSFVPVGAPASIPLWLINLFTGDAVAFPVGSRNGGSTFTFILCVAGLIALWRGGRRAWGMAMLLPVALHLIASAMQRYPMGGHVRFSIYLMPVICLLAGVGAAALAQLWRDPVRRRQAVATTCAALILVGACSVARDVVFPYKTHSDQRARALAQWLWFELPHEGEVACLLTDMGIDFSPGGQDELSWTAMYLVNQRMNSPRLRSGLAIDPTKVTRDHPLYVVEFRQGVQPYDDVAQRRWLEGMQQRYRLDGRQSFPMTRYDKRERKVIQKDHILLYRFVPQ